MPETDLLRRNQDAWDRESRAGSAWTTPVNADAVRAARAGELRIVLTPNRIVPAAWLHPLQGRDVLCLASGGGQQAPLLAAAGARVTSFDLSGEQLAKDAAVAEREGLALRCVQGDMADLSALAEASFDLIFHPISNVFVPDVRPVWRECHRVLRPGGALLAGFLQPGFFLFDHDEAERTGTCVVRYTLPYAEPDSLDDAGRDALARSGRALEFSHSLEAQIAGQLEAGFVLTGLYEDGWDEADTPYRHHAPIAIATRAIKSS